MCDSAIHRQLISRILIVGTCFFLAGPIEAKVRTNTYEQDVTYLNKMLDDIARVHSLDEVSTKQVKLSVLVWMLGGPCQEPLHSGYDSIFGDALQGSMFVGGSAFELAFHQSVSMLMAKSLGRKPSGDLCRYARESLPPKD
jgi:hypothetical protein